MNKKNCSPIGASRRTFLRQSLLTGAAVFSAPTIVPASVFGSRAPSNRIQVAAIGVGRISRDHDLPGVIGSDLARVIAVCDLDSKRCREGKELVEASYAKKGMANSGVRMYGDYRELLQSQEIDAVVISTPDHWHAKPAIDAAAAGKHIYLQKPASLTVAEGRVMSDMVHRSGITFQLGTQQRSMEQFRIAAELVRNGRIGRITSIKIGLPVDPSGEDEPEMPIPGNLNYEMWLGSTPWVYYTEKRVHPQNDYSRPGWLRCEQFGAGMITGWGVHHFDIAHWGIGAEHAGPLEIQADAEFPGKGLWNVHGKYTVDLVYPDNIQVQVSDQLPNGVRFEGSEGWIFVTRGNYAATGSDPAQQAQKEQALTASNPKILTSKIRPDEIHLPVSQEQHVNWLESIRSGQQPVSPVEVGHRSTSVCLVSHIAMKLKRKLYWDAWRERFKNDDEANAMLSRPQRAPWGI
jgi:predicted dehydrogenase